MRRALHLLVTTALVVAACGVPESGDFRPIPKSELPFDLGRPLNTTTTSTTSTIPADGTVIQLYFVAGVFLTSEPRVIAGEPEPTSAVRLLVLGPIAFPEYGLTRTALPAALDFDVDVEKGVATVNTSKGLLTDVAAADQILVVGQIVLTLTSLPGIGQVRFTVNNKPQSVPRGGGDLTAPGGEVTFDDYVGLVSSQNQ